MFGIIGIAFLKFEYPFFRKIDKIREVSQTVQLSISWNNKNIVEMFDLNWRFSKFSLQN